MNVIQAISQSESLTNSDNLVHTDDTMQNNSLLNNVNSSSASTFSSTPPQQLYQQQQQQQQQQRNILIETAVLPTKQAGIGAEPTTTTTTTTATTTTTNNTNLHKHLHEEIYDNLNVSNPIEASYIIEDDDDEDLKKFQQQQQHLFKLKADVDLDMTEDILMMNKSGSLSAHSSNNRFMTTSSRNKFSAASSLYFQQQLQQQLNDQNLSSNSFNNQVSEEIEDESVDQITATNNNNNDDVELRNYDEDDQCGQNEDEFFLISTPSPFMSSSAHLNNNRATLLHNNNYHNDHYHDDDEDEDQEDDDEEDEDEDEEEDEDEIVYNQQINGGSGGSLRYQVQYELNRLSNIIEEEDFNYDEDEDPAKAENNNKDEASKPLVATTAVAEDTDSLNESAAYLNKENMDTFKEMLLLGNDIKETYSQIDNQLNSDFSNVTSTGYKPTMKKRVYHLNGAYLKPESCENQSDKGNEPSTLLLSTTRVEPARPITQNNNKNSNSNNNTNNTLEEKPESSSASSEYSMLNYLIGRLSEQHKVKLADSSTSHLKSKLEANEDEETKAKINSEFEEFEKRLFEKYALPSIETKYSRELNDPSDKHQHQLQHQQQQQQQKQQLLNLNEIAAAAAVAANSQDTKLNDTSYILTRSLYAEHKRISLEIEPRQQLQIVSSTSSMPSTDSVIMSSPSTNKLITALSINEIETRKSFCMDNSEAKSEHDNTDNEQDQENNNNSSSNSSLDCLPDEKKIKEEIVLIGEKSDIESLLDNKNNQLFNLILANSSRASKLEEIESNLTKKRIKKLRVSRELPTNETTVAVIEEKSPQSQQQQQESRGDIEIEIQYDEKVNQQQQQPEESQQDFELNLKEIAKYLVDEITKISVNKLKIDYLNETLNKKYFSNDLLTKHEVLTNLIDSDPSPAPSNDSSPPNIENKSREELFDYYTNLERNLQQIREEIDKLKREAYDDLAYINDILTDEQSDDNTLNDDLAVPADVEIMDDDMDQQNLSITPRNYSPTKQQHQHHQHHQTIQVPYAKQDVDTDELEEEDDTQYLSQAATSVSNVTSVNGNASSSQVYLTPAESWQTLVNSKNNNSDLILENEKTIRLIANNINDHLVIENLINNDNYNTNNNNNNASNYNGDQTDLDEEDHEEEDINNEDDETSTTITSHGFFNNNENTVCEFLINTSKGKLDLIRICIKNTKSKSHKIIHISKKYNSYITLK